MTKFIDTHAHLYWEDYQNDLSEVVQRANDAGVTEAIIVGVDPITSQKAAEFKTDGLTIYSSVGIHPHDAHRYANNPTELIEQDVTRLKEIALEYPNKVKLIGECGLDFFFNREHIPSDVSNEDFKHLQRMLFKAQIELAKKLDLPMTVHCRDDRSQNPDNIECWLECLELLQDSRGILHCYSGLPPITQKALQMNFLISFAANITYPKNQYLRDAIQTLPLEKIVLETDCPFLSPQSSRGQRNEPKAVLESAQLIAELKNVSVEQVASITSQNIHSMLKLT